MNAPRPLMPHALALIDSQFSVPGMRCAGCIAKLERGLSNTPGIVAARVNFTARRVMLTHDPALDLPALRAAFAGVGFDAEPLADASADSDRESRRLVRAMAVAGFAAMNIMLLSVSVWSGAEGRTRDLFHLLSGVIALPTIVYSGRPFFASAWRALRHGRTNMDVPISIGVLLATALSAYETATGGAHAYFDGAVMLLFFLLAGRWVDSVMRDRAREGVAALMKQAAHGAWICLPDGTTRWTDATMVEPGMTMLVTAGERLPVDAVVEGHGARFDCSLLTGESQPVLCVAGDAVPAGALAIDGPVRVRATTTADAGAMAEIARLIEVAGQGRSRYVRVADRAARLYAPAVHLLALVALVGWMIAGADLHHALTIAIAVLIITCPCALGLAVPVAQVIVSGALMRRGVLVKDGGALERLAEADAVVFDKTGTLTLGRPEPIDLDALHEGDRALMRALAMHSRHPLSLSLTRALQGTVPAMLDNLRDVPGRGMFAKADGTAIALTQTDDRIEDGLLAVALHLGSGRIETVRFTDALRPDAADTVRRLAEMGLPGEILSGDRAPGVRPVAAEVGLFARTSMSPADKLAVIEAKQAAGARVLVIGDGLNDGPALAAGHVSIAPASASSVGQNTADIVFLGDSLSPVAVAVAAARRTRTVVRQNFALAIGYNLFAVPLAVMGHVTPLIAAAAMSGSSLIVIANAMRLRSAAR